MKLRPLQSIAMAAILLLLLAPQYACTILGSIAGAADDARRAESRIIPTGEAVTVRPGTRLIVRLRDGQRLEAVYRDTTRLGDPDYLALWQRWLAIPGHVNSVAPGDRVTVVDGDGEWPAVFVGYHYRSIEVTTSGDSLRRIPLASLRRLSNAREEVWTGRELEAFDTAGLIPSRMGVVLRTQGAARGISVTDGATRAISLSEILTISPTPGHSGQIGGMIVGMALDALVVTALVREPKSNDLGCAILLLGLASSLPPDVQLTPQPYDRLAGQFVPEVGGRQVETSRAAPAH